MSKITQTAISRKWLHQKKKKKGASELHILTPLQIFDSKFKIPIATEIRQFFDIWAIGT